jgi:acetyl esterase
VLIYPVTDLSSFETDSHRDLAEGYFLTRAAMNWFTGHYLPGPNLARHPEVSPLLASDVSGLPPGLVITAEFDPLRDEGEAYAQRFARQGCPSPSAATREWFMDSFPCEEYSPVAARRLTK